METEYISNGSQFIFQAAVDFLKEKSSLTPEEYNQLDDECKNKAFTVSGYTSAEVLNTFLDTLTKACEEGTTKEQFMKDMNGFLMEHGYSPLNPWKSDIIFRTNMQTAMNVGHYQSMSEPMTKKLRPYWQYKTAGDNRVRDDHAAMHNRVYAADDPIWDIWYPPNGFGCRCMVVTLSRKQFERMDVPLCTRPPFHANQSAGIRFMTPDKGFHNNPAKSRWKPDLEVLRPEVRAVTQIKP